METLADETTEDEAEDLIDLTSAKQQRQWTVAQSAQHSNHRLQHSPKVTFFDTDNASATRGEEEKHDGRDRSYQSSLVIRFVVALVSLGREGKFLVLGPFFVDSDSMRIAEFDGPGFT